MLQFDPDFALPELEKDLYFIPVCQIGAAKLKRNGLLKNSLDWKWEGVLHEVVTCPHPVTSDTLQGIVNLCNTNENGTSGRSQGTQEEKYLRDAKILEEALKKEPQNSRYAYYLGISYSAAKKYELAKKSFEKRLSMPSADLEETYQALYNLGIMKESLGDLEGAAQTFLEAHVFRSNRAEPLFQCAKVYRQMNQIPLAYVVSKMALTLPYPEQELCIDYTIYDHALLIEYANCALLLGKFDEGLDACAKLLANPHLPEEYKIPVQSNYDLAFSKLHLPQ